MSGLSSRQITASSCDRCETLSIATRKIHGIRISIPCRRRSGETIMIFPSFHSDFMRETDKASPNRSSSLIQNQAAGSEAKVTVGSRKTLEIVGII